MKKVLTLVGLALSLTSCASSGYQKYYQSEATAENLATVQLLKQGETPKIMHVDDLRASLDDAFAKNYKIIGKAIFNGGLEGEDAVAEQAKKVHATHVLVASKFTETRQITTPLYMPTTSTTYNSGYVSNGFSGANYSGTSTTYGSTVVPFTTHQQRYDQAAVFLAKSKITPRIGIFVTDLDQAERSKLERNTGALIKMVIEQTPAFYANVITGDILTEVNGAPVMNAKNAGELLSQVPSGRPMELRVLRHGEEKKISVTPQ